MYRANHWQKESELCKNVMLFAQTCSSAGGFKELDRIIGSKSSENNLLEFVNQCVARSGSFFSSWHQEWMTEMM